MLQGIALAMHYAKNVQRLYLSGYSETTKPEEYPTLTRRGTADFAARNHT